MHRNDWDSVVKNAEKTEHEAAQNETALKHYQKIYGNNSHEGKKAMNKSFQESCNTVLDTNWDLVFKGQILNFIN